MSTHRLKLATVPFDAIVSGQKTIESRLYDEKRRQIQIGDKIIFTNRENPDQAVTVEVIGLLRYKTFKDLFYHNNPGKFGGESVQWLVLNRILSLHSQATSKIVAINRKVYHD